MPGRVAQSVTCLATDAYLTADPGVASSIPVRSHTFVEIEHEMISTVILFPSADSFIQEGLLSVTSESMCTNYWLTACSSLPRKKCGKVTDSPAMTIAVDLGRKATKQTNKRSVTEIKDHATNFPNDSRLVFYDCTFLDRKR